MKTSGVVRVMRGALFTGALLLLSTAWTGGCSSHAGFTLPPLPRRVCSALALPPQCGQACQDNNVGYAVDNAGWLLYNQIVAGKPAGNVNVTASCPLGGTVAVTGTVNVASNGVNSTQLTFSMTDCGVSAKTFSLTLTGALQMTGTFTGKSQNDITFSSSNLALVGQLNILDDPSVNEQCAVSMTDTWNYDPKDTGWLNGLVCGRIADGSVLVPPSDAMTSVDWKCLLESMELEENGQPVEFADVPDAALADADGGVPVTGGDAPQIINSPDAMSFANGNSSSLELDFTDPTASRPAFFMTLRPTRGPMCLDKCCWGCRATRRRFDHLTSGVVKYEAAANADPFAASAGQLIVYPVSCAESGADPVDAANSGAPCSLLIGSPAPVGVSFGAPTNGDSSGGSGGSGGGSSSSPGGASSAGGSSGTTCNSNADCNCTCGSNPGEPNNGGVCSGGACHCCYGACGVDVQTGVTSSCMCLSCASDSDCSQLAYPTCVGNVCISKNSGPKCP